MMRTFLPTRRQSAGRRPPRLRGARLTPQLEVLEDRSLPSAFTVINLGDTGAGSGSQGDLRYCIDQANALPGADVINFAGGLTGTIRLGSELPITDDLTVDGPGADNLTVSGNDATRAFRVSGAGTDVAISGLTVADCRVNTVTFSDFNADYGPVTLGGGVLNDGARLTLSQMTFRDNRADGPDLPKDNSDGGGGAIANVHGGQLTVRYSTFTGNSASGLDYAGGGAVVSDGGKSFDVNGENYAGTKAVLDHCTFTDNQATRSLYFSGGGALYDGTASEMVVSACTFAGNLSQGGTVRQAHAAGGGYGGALIAERDGFFNGPSSQSQTTVEISRSTFSGNQALAGSGHGGWTGGGGAVLADNGTEVTITLSSFTGNLARGRDDTGGNVSSAGDALGGAIASFGATLDVGNSAFADNQAWGGTGGQGAFGGQALGGAIAATPAPTPTPGVLILPYTTIDHCELTGNRAVGGVGDNDPTDPLTSYFGGSARGGAVSNIIGPLTLSNSQLVGNVAQGGGGALGKGGDARGGGLCNEFGATAVLTNVRIADNQAVGGAGGVGGNGGNALGGGVFIGVSYAGRAATLTLSSCTVTANAAEGGAGGVGGSGGNALGGGVFNGNPYGSATPAATVQMDHTDVTDNRADGGPAGSGDSAGAGVGGGIYHLGDYFVDVLSAIEDNEASTGYDDVFGNLTLR